MKKNELTKAVLAALVFASSSVLAASDYPAADFQPKVVFSDESAQKATESKAPAAEAKVEAADPNFPAANYQPKVLYSDADYKHSSAAPSLPGGASKSAASSAASVSAAEEVQAEEPASSDFSLIGLIVLGAAGFYFFSKKQSGGSTGTAASVDYTASASGSTGVEKYLEKMGANKTGVAKYLEKQTENPKTGVAKYMAKQIVKDREAAAAKATGVEKYLRDKA